MLDGGKVNFLRKWHHIKLTMGDAWLFYVIPMDKENIVLGVKWLIALERIEMSF